jgi:putative transposase
MAKVRRLKRMRQLEIRFRTWGGKREGAGRKLRGKPRVSHLRRPQFAARLPQHVTVWMLPSVWSMRSRRCFSAIRRAMYRGAEKDFGFRLVHFAVMSNHIHFLVEASGKEALSRGMQGLNIRIAKALNRVMERHGKVFADHYHSQILRTPTQTANARQYLLNNAFNHYGWLGRDPFVSIFAVVDPQTYLLALINRDLRLIRVPSAPS